MIEAFQVAVLDRLRLFEKTLLPLVLMAALFAVTIGLGAAIRTSGSSVFSNSRSRSSTAT